MRFNLGLEMDPKANLIITFDCGACGLPQRRAFRLVNVGDVITCACGSAATVDENTFVGLQAQIDLLRQKVAVMNMLFRQKPPIRSPSTRGAGPDNTDEQTQKAS